VGGKRGEGEASAHYIAKLGGLGGAQAQEELHPIRGRNNRRRI